MNDQSRGRYGAELRCTHSLTVAAPNEVAAPIP